MKVEIELPINFAEEQMIKTFKDMGLYNEFMRSCLAIGLLIAQRAGSGEEVKRRFTMLLNDEVDFEKPTKKPKEEVTPSPDWEAAPFWDPSKRRAKG